MPLLRCTNDECQHQWFEASRLAEGTECIECGSETVLVGRDDDEPHDYRPTVPGRPEREEGPRLAHARERARGVLREHGVTKPPVPVRAIARREEIEIEDDVALGALRGRLFERRIQLAPDSESVKRFTIAHELGHHFLKTRHGDGPHVESEANAFAGELLVPGPMLHSALARTTSAAELAMTFQVSRTVIRIAAETHKKGSVLT